MENKFTHVLLCNFHHASHPYLSVGCIETASHSTPLPRLILECDLDPVDSQWRSGRVCAAIVVSIELFECLLNQRSSISLNLNLSM